MTSSPYCRTGFAVSTREAFLLFEKWRKTRSYIVLRSVSRRELSLFRGSIVDVMRRSQKLLIRMTPSNSNRSVFTGFDLRNACFECTEPHESFDVDLVGEEWQCCLSAHLQSGELLVFAVHKQADKCL
jgi:hypothetical protein